VKVDPAPDGGVMERQEVILCSHSVLPQTTISIQDAEKLKDFKPACVCPKEQEGVKAFDFAWAVYDIETDLHVWDACDGNYKSNDSKLSSWWVSLTNVFSLEEAVMGAILLLADHWSSVGDVHGMDVQVLRSLFDIRERNGFIIAEARFKSWQVTSDHLLQHWQVVQVAAGLLAYFIGEIKIVGGMDCDEWSHRCPTCLVVRMRKEFSSDRLRRGRECVSCEKGDEVPFFSFRYALKDFRIAHPLVGVLMDYGDTGEVARPRVPVLHSPPPMLRICDIPRGERENRTRMDSLLSIVRAFVDDRISLPSWDWDIDDDSPPLRQQRDLDQNDYARLAAERSCLKVYCIGCDRYLPVTCYDIVELAKDQDHRGCVRCCDEVRQALFGLAS